MSPINQTINFTEHSENDFYDTVDTETFQDEDAESIYEHLQSRIKLIPFCDYLKRYIFRIAGFEGSFQDVDLKEYQEIIVESFSENRTPKSFTETSAKLSALAKNWLTQRSVNRQVVFLLGFGLNMSDRDVSEFLVHAQRERDFNFKNPFEVICWYCYRNGYKYQKLEKLLEEYEALPVQQEYIDLGATIGVKNIFMTIETEEDLLRALSRLKMDNKGQFFSYSARKHFNELYEQTKLVILEQYRQDAVAEAEEKAKDYFFSVSNSTVLTNEEKYLRAEKIRKSPKVYTLEDITESDVEKFLCCGVPFDKKGNLIKASKSSLAKQFNNKRMSRQHLHEIIAGKVDVDRFDLLTLLFFIHAMDDRITNSKTRFIHFVDESNRILNDCSMGELYIANPYECFLLMCILSIYPMGTYADVLEKSFEEE